jgi:peptidoglycan/LPS O-acetylase OafA/YrhL
LVDPAGYHDILIVNCVDRLSAGALLAYLHSVGFKFNTSHKVGYFIAACLGSVVLLSDLGLLHGIIISLCYDTAMSVLTLMLVHRASAGLSGKMGSFLENKGLIYIGKISYGIYLYHNFIPALYSKLFAKMGLEDRLIPFGGGHTFFPVVHNKFIMFPLFFVTLMAVATLSWYFFEQPINNLKSRFGYKKTLVAAG